MTTTKIQRIVIAGGGTAGWMAAAAMSKQLAKVIEVVLIESEQIGTIAVGEATIPPIRTFHSLLGLNEADFMKSTSATFKLGIEFDHWKKIGESYIHAFGQVGQESFFADFHHFWLRSIKEGNTSNFSDYSFEFHAAKSGKFAISEQPKVNYAYHLDATAYAKYLRSYSEARGVKRIEGKINKVLKNKDNGYISGLELDSGETISGDMFIDCTGFKGLLIEEALNTGYEDWSHWLPCDSAYVVQTESTGDVLPYTRSIAHQAGWRWKIPLQHRDGNGLVYCSKYLADHEAKEQLLINLEGKPISEPRLIKFRTGRRIKAWNKNCVAFGLSSGFIEPLESTSIQMIMSGVFRFIRMFSTGEIEDVVVDEYNNQAKLEAERIRDFIILHYHITQRNDSEFWDFCRNMDIPETLARRIALFKKNAHVLQTEGELFRINSWIQVMFGQGIMPKAYNPIVHAISDNELKSSLNSMREALLDNVNRLPSHQAFINQYCKMPER